MISKLILHGFQCHKKLVIKFGKITTIVGPTDAGKSAIIRGLRWVMLNRPAGTTIIHRGSDNCEVRASIDGLYVFRKRGKSNNTYTLDQNEYKAFGNSVPKPIKDLVNVCEDNFQKQHDSPYWLDMSPGEVSRALNEVVDLEVIDRTLSNLNRSIRSAKAAAEVSLERFKEIKAGRKRLRFVPRMNRDLKKLEAQQESLIEQGSHIEYLRGLKDNVTRYNKRNKRAGKLVKEFEPALDKLEQAYSEYRDKEERRRNLRIALDDIEMRRDKVDRIDKELSETESELSAYETCPWCGSEL